MLAQTKVVAQRESLPVTGSSCTEMRGVAADAACEADAKNNNAKLE